MKEKLYLILIFIFLGGCQEQATQPGDYIVTWDLSWLYQFLNWLLRMLFWGIGGIILALPWIFLILIMLALWIYIKNNWRKKS